ncbi:MAG: DUF4302 domain-containing protein [Dysgonamonadaceae bacterium]|jgi:hypothetical protein|nr:DUF4302 domain-containing protein [Dysgonamonadaceae bacterium]
MKSYIYLFLFAFLFTACSEEDRIFSEASGTRTAKYVDECYSLLQSSEQGWKMTYCPDAASYGDYHFLMKFKADNRVEMLSEFSDEAITSSYRIDMSQGPILVFDTYNYIHELSKPNNNPPYGLSGDFEFVIKNTSENAIELAGRKKNIPVRLEKATEQDWDDMGKMYFIQDNIKLHTEGKTKEIWVVEVNGKNVKGSLVADPLKRTCTITCGSVVVAGIYTLTPNEVKFNKEIALEVEGTTIRFDGLKFQAGATLADRKFISNDANASLVFSIDTEIVLGYNDFLGDYIFRYAISNTATTQTRSLDVTLLAEETGKTYRLEGLLADNSPGKLIVNFNSNGTISMLGQVMYVYPDTKYDFWLLPYSYPINGNYTSRTTTYGLVSKEIEVIDGKLKFKMLDNELWVGYGGVAGFLLRNYEGSTNRGNVNGKDAQPFYFFPVFEQK